MTNTIYYFSTHIIHRFLSTQEKSIRLATVSAKHRMLKKAAKKSKKAGDFSGLYSDDIDSDLTICETKDLVKVGIRADIFYSITDPEKCILKIDTDELEDLVRETAIATLTNIIRSTALNQIAQSKNVSAGNVVDRLGESLPPAVKPTGVKDRIDSFEQMSDSPPPSAPMAEFFDKTHDEFMSKVS